MEIKTKRCFSCKQTKPVTDFYADRCRYDGIRNRCKDCNRLAYRSRRIRNNYKDGKDKRYYDKNKEKIKEKRRLKSVIDKDKLLARQRVREAIKNGLLAKKPCNFCSKEEVEAHHHDYSKPLDVIWLCNSCHQRLHALEKKSALN